MYTLHVLHTHKWKGTVSEKAVGKQAQVEPLRNDTRVTVTLTSFYHSVIIIQSSLSCQVQIL